LIIAENCGDILFQTDNIGALFQPFNILAPDTSLKVGDIILRSQISVASDFFITPPFLSGRLSGTDYPYFFTYQSSWQNLLLTRLFSDVHPGRAENTM
jgi:hypothetical protein